MKKQIILALSLALVLSSCQSESNDKSIDDKLKSNEYSQMADKKSDKSDDFSNSSEKQSQKTPIEDRLIVKDNKNTNDKKVEDKDTHESEVNNKLENKEKFDTKESKQTINSDDYTLVTKDGMYGIALQGPENRDYGYLEKCEIKDGYLYADASFTYSENENGSFGNEITEFSKYKFKLNHVAVFVAKSGESKPHYMEIDEFLSYLDECMGTGLAFIIIVSDSEVAEVCISS